MNAVETVDNEDPSVDAGTRDAVDAANTDLTACIDFTGRYYLR